MKFLLIKAKRHLDKAPILDSNYYSFTDKMKNDDDLQNAIEKNQQLESEIKVQNADFEKIIENL